MNLEKIKTKKKTKIELIAKKKTVLEKDLEKPMLN